MPFVKYDPWPGHEFGAGDFTDHTGRSTPLYDPGLAQQLTANNDVSMPEPNQSVSDTGNWSVDTGPAQIEAKPGAPVANGKDYEAGASEFLKANRQNPGATQTTPDGKVMVVEPHPAAPERGLPTEHPGVTVREPAAEQDPYPKDFTPQERKAVASIADRFPGVSEQGILNIFKNESGYNSKAVNPKSGAAGIFQLMPDQQPAGQKFAELPREEQIAQYGAYLEGKQKKFGPIQSDADLAVANAAPALLGKPDDAVAYPAGSKAATDNPAWQDASGNVTVGAIKKYYGAAGGEPGKPQTKEQQLAAYINGSAGGMSTEQKTLTKTESGTPYTAEDQAGLFARTEKHNADMAAANQPVLDAQAQAVEKGIATQQKIQDSLDAAQQREQAAKAAYDESMGRVRTGVDEVLADKQPPPFGGNIFATVLASIAQGMGAYAAAINKTENFAANAINTALKRENDRWAQAHLDKQYKVKQDQELSRDQWYQFKSALSERELQQRMLIDHELQQNLALSKNADSAKALNLMIADNNARAEAENANLTRLARGRSSTEIMSEQKHKEGDNSLADQNKRAQALVDSGKATKEEVAGARGAAIPVSDKDYQAYASGKREGQPSRNAIESQKANLQTLVPVLGLDWNDKAGQFVDKPGAADMVPRNPFTGSALGETMVGVSNLTKSDKEAEKRREAFTRLGSVINAQLYLDSGKAINETEAKRKAEEFKGMSRQDQVRNLNELLTGLEQKKKALAAEFPGAEEAYDTRFNKKKDVTFTPGVNP